MFTTILVLAILGGGAAWVISKQPDRFAITRSAEINVMPDKIFPHINEAVAWAEWSPWSKIDPNGTFNYTGPASGVGATTHWSGNMKLGVGTSVISESIPNERVSMNLNFQKPIAGKSTASITLTPQSNTTTVTWTMEGTNSFLGKAFSLIFNCEEMVGLQFEQGLINLKTLCEST